MAEKLITPDEKEKAEKRIRQLETQRQHLTNTHIKDMHDIDNELAKLKMLVKKFKEQNRGSAAIDDD